MLQQSFKSHQPHPLALLGNDIFSCLVTDPDTTTLKEALQQDNRYNFLQVMSKELHYHIFRNHWKVITRRSAPPHKTCILMVWSVKRKRNPVGEVIKWKERLCAGGHRSVEFVD